MEGSVDDGFEYIPRRSTSSIFYHHDIIDPRPHVLQWRATPTNPTLQETDDNFDTDPQQNTVCSSCQGLIAIRNNLTNAYHVGNPYQPDIPYRVTIRYAYLPNPPRYNPNTTHVVLAVDTSPAQLIPLDVPPCVFLLICVAQQPGNFYRFDQFVTYHCAWDSFEVKFRRDYGPIEPNSGVSLGKTGYWLLGEPGEVPTYLLRFLISSLDYDPQETVAVINLPPCGDQGRMQLGRTMGRLGLVVVNEADSTVELFTLQDDNPEEPFQREVLFNVVVDEDAEDVAMWRQEEMSMVCREMPRPI